MKPTLLLLAVLVGLTACKSSKAEHEDAHEAGHDEAAPEKLHVESGDVIHVHVPPEMLRDLRVTTAKVEAARGERASPRWES
ncbi:hypothetical protein [Corallococcus sp. 4LFB]|uniref:hypothetical protein n=1 Tax=Corallococcus sp. 4LFB TaxID=3383249 RepID=UPI0039766624